MHAGGGMKLSHFANWLFVELSFNTWVGTFLETSAGLDSDYSTTLHGLSHSVLYHPCEVGISICL